MKSLPDRFFCREDTLQGDYQRARRSFFKWVCKQELYGTLQISHCGNWISHHRGPSKYDWGRDFTYGYPQFRRWRSEAYNQWDRKFQEVRERWIAEQKARWRRESEEYFRAHEGRERQRFHNSEAVEIFQLLGAAHEIGNIDLSQH